MGAGGRRCPSLSQGVTMMGKRLMLGITVGAILVLGSAGGAFAGEVGGNGQETPAAEKARSLCAFSGLEDFDGAGVQPGVTQNWGQIPQEVRKALSSRGASDVAVIGEGCNAKMYPNK